MKQALFILSVLGMGVAQTSGAAETTFQSNNTLTHTITNISAASNYGSSRNIYSTNSGAYVSSNDEISQAIDNLSAHAKQKEYQLASLTNRLSYDQIVILLLLLQQQTLQESLYLIVLVIVLVMSVKRYNQRAMNSRLMRQLISMLLAVHWHKRALAKSVTTCSHRLVM